MPLARVCRTNHLCPALQMAGRADVIDQLLACLKDHSPASQVHAARCLAGIALHLPLEQEREVCDS